MKNIIWPEWFYYSLDAAKFYCNKNPDCGGVMVDSCDDRFFGLCRKGTIESISSEDCVYKNHRKEK